MSWALLVGSREARPKNVAKPGQQERENLLNQGYGLFEEMMKRPFDFVSDWLEVLLACLECGGGGLPMAKRG